MVSKNHTITLCRSKKFKESNRKHNFHSQPKYKPKFFAVIGTKPVEIVF